MTAPPLPDIPCVRIRTIWNLASAGEGGNRFYLSYTGTAPTGANCTSLAASVASEWGTSIAPLMPDNYTLQEVDVLDIATDSGLSGQWTGTQSGSRSGAYLPDSVANNIEFGIARRYRGGKPRMFLPPGVQSDLTTQSSWTSGFVTETETNVTAFFAAMQALVVGAMGTLTHVNLSFYKGFTNIINSSGRERAAPTYRTVALHDNVTGYSAKAIVGSQKRRRTSTTP